MDFELVAAQLRKPDGEFGKKLAQNMNISNRYINLLAIEKLDVQAGDNILEIGMGNGFFVKEILRRNAAIKYTGCDFSETMIDEAALVNQEFVENGQALFLQAAAGKLPFHSHSFNKAFSINTIYFWENPATELAEIHSVLKHCGKFILAVRPKNIMEKYPFSPFGFRMYEKDELAEMLEKNNFNITEILEKQEPEQEISGKKYKVESLILLAEAVKE